jgi:hypothetical protein
MQASSEIGSDFTQTRQAVEQIEDVVDCLWSYKTALILTMSGGDMHLDEMEPATEAVSPSVESLAPDAIESDVESALNLNVADARLATFIAMRLAI